jgi:cyclohexadieny/prephenate dehydrogenase
MAIQTLTIVGVGLIGGSIGLAAKRGGLARRVLGAGRQQTSLDRALAVGAIDEAFLDVAAAVHQADFVVFCTPVDRIVEQVIALAPGCSKGALLTDAGSTKAAIVRGIEDRLPPDVAFIGSHPIAGSEKRGPEHARADLFQGRVTVVTPTPRTDAGVLGRAIQFWEALGSTVWKMSPEDHDQALALTSHLPHLVASALVGLLPPPLDFLVGTGFRDTTRIASGDPEVWTGIFLQNRKMMIDAVDQMQGRLIGFKQALLAADREKLDALLAQAKRIRDALGT